MDKLSFELLEQIIGYLSAGDALSLAKMSRRIRTACHSRLDPERYLQPTFKYARYLLAAMTDFGCVLSGSRALEYFVPGSIEHPRQSLGGPVSDWDFLVPCHKGSVFGMMDALARCGVRWQDSMAELFGLVGKPAGSSALIRAQSVMPILPSHLASDAPEALSVEALALYRRLHSFVYVHTDPDARSWVNVEVVQDHPPASSEPGSNYAFEEILLQDMQYRGFHPHTGRPLTSEEVDGADIVPTGPEAYHGYGYAPNNTVHLINGFITPPGGLRQKVQLFQCHHDKHKASTPLEYIVDTYYATHVQCFISGWAAGHFYYDLARQKMSLVWHVPFGKAEKELKTCIQKYRARGYRFFRPAVGEQEMNRTSCTEYDDDLGCVRHDDSNPLFRKAVYTPEQHISIDTAVRPTDVTRAFENIHIKPGPVGAGEGPQRWTSPRCSDTILVEGTNPAPLTTIKTGRLSHEGYATLKRDGGRISSGKLGKTGTKLVRFHRLQAGLHEATRTDIEAARAAPKLQVFYKTLEYLLCQFQFVTLGRPVAAKLKLARGVPWGGATDSFGSPTAAPSLSQALACASVGDDGDDLGARGAPPGTPTTRFDSARKEWSNYELLLLMTPTACNWNDCDASLGFSLPPQI
ncbi:uncharacterized protein SPSK_04105 [Sporothrix schenckii 1099-18]|uniref:F-box domain-containing protein n=1 Tax=Sporothrix schenckii 1099-18 TaxID=1397361 RepID=A0A0F2M2J1_SPOSC|nr:uncharacterized protein SPSK_04105 [Sporothrix schenckii 1099-18]KJR83324.1 hypothetical protein SPSK_04105 [Sporothrix schenckii 1099-18]